MIIGVPKEVKDHETRVGLVPSGVTALREAGHEVLVETHAGEGSSITDREYMQAGAHDSAQRRPRSGSKADLVVKVKEPQPSEYALFPPGPDPVHVSAPGAAAGADRPAAGRQVNGVAYETIREADGSLPLLTPMSEVAGRMAVQVGAQYLERPTAAAAFCWAACPAWRRPTW